VGQLEDRIERLEESLVLVPSIQEYLGARNREHVRVLHKFIVEREPALPRPDQELVQDVSG
jgi:hypothetical protein